MSDWVFEAAERTSLAVEGLDARFPVRRVYCVGQNYAAHAREMGVTDRAVPLFFDKPADALCMASEVPYPPGTNDLHHEVELVVALGSGGRDLDLQQAERCIYGYAVGVDLTRRDLQAAAKKRGAPWTTAKGFDHSAPVSAIRPLGLIDHPTNADIRLAVNGLLRPPGTTAEMIWSVPEIIAELSRLFELKAGDLVFTGTPAGVGPLEQGDLVGCSVEGAGTLAFMMV